MDPNEFREHGHQLVDWIAGYLENIRDYPVKSLVKPGEIFGALPDTPPDQPESFGQIFSDFEKIIMPGITHWQSPGFQAYFPANSSNPSLLAEMLIAAIGAQCMIWDTSPAATELEEKMTEWLKSMLGLPHEFRGVIQDTASTSTLCAILSAREKISQFGINREGFKKGDKYRIYCSSETHSSIEKAVKIAGFGKENLVKIEVDSTFRMNPARLAAQIKEDTSSGFIPVCVVATLGTTGSTAIDPLDRIAEICSEYDVWLHVDAAFAGTALLLEEYRWMISGLEKADSFVFNPHKWMFTNFDCSVYFVKDSESLIRTFEINPEYLRTRQSAGVNNYRDWGIQLGRRFRALKLWFVIRSYGLDGLKKKIRDHIEWAGWLRNEIIRTEGFTLLAPVTFNTICFNYTPAGYSSPEMINHFNEILLQEINSSGKVYLSHTKLNGIYTIRIVCGQTNLVFSDVEKTWSIIQEKVKQLVVGHGLS